jgi:hypothetical protein
MEAVQTFGRKVSFWRRGDKKKINILHLITLIVCMQYFWRTLMAFLTMATKTVKI